MSIKLMSMVYGHQFGDPALKAVALKLADYADDYGQNIWPAINTIARQTEYSRDTVNRRLRQLIEAAAIRKQRTGGW